MQHDIENFKLNLPIRAEYISFRGHSHFYHVRKNRRIYIPALCDSSIYYRSNPYLKTDIVKPGFLTAEIDDDNIVIINYSFTSVGIVKENEYTKVLKRK